MAKKSIMKKRIPKNVVDYDFVKKCIINSGFKIYKVGIKLGLDYKMIRNRLSGRTAFTVEELLKLAELLGVPLHLMLHKDMSWEQLKQIISA